MQPKRAIIVGATSGIGAAIARQLVRDGWKVAAIGRREDRLRELASQNPDLMLTFPHDVTRYSDVPALFQEVCRQLGGVDAIYYASGVMPEVRPDEFDFEKDKAMVEVNLLGAIAWLNQAAIRFRGTRGGAIVGIGSVAGDRGRQGQPVYNASKAALATYLEALRNRLSRHGVRVTTIKPGPVDTEMTKELHLRGAMDVEEAARRIVAKSRSGGEEYLKATHWLIFWIIKRLPSGLMRRLRI